MLWLPLTLTLLGQAPAPTSLQPATPTAAPVSLAQSTTQRKSTSMLIASGELLIGTAAGYLGLLTGILLNFGHGGWSGWPPGGDDILFLAVIPAGAAIAGSWLIGLFDWSQRSVLGSLLFAALGGAAGEVVGLCAGALLGRSLYPNDWGASAIVIIALAPLFAAIGSTLFMEIFKPGETVSASAAAPKSSVFPSLALARSGAGWVLTPALAVQF